jgi:hypothetical protein
MGTEAPLCFSTLPYPSVNQLYPATRSCTPQLRCRKIDEVVNRQSWIQRRDDFLLQDLVLLLLLPSPYRRSQLLQQQFRLLPSNASVRNADAILQPRKPVGTYVLPAFIEAVSVSQIRLRVDKEMTRHDTTRNLANQATHPLSNDSPA